MHAAVPLASLLLLAASPLSAQQPPSRPNIVVVITDDQGYGDLSCHGNPLLKTPNLDALAAESVRLTDYHVAPTCSPTRAALQTGRWTNRTGVWHTINGRSLLRDDEVTLGEVFQRAGYATGMFGKWHLGDNAPCRPQDCGYGEAFYHGGGGVGQTPDHWDNSYFDGAYFRNGQPEPVEGFCTAVFFRAATEFIDARHRDDRPFFVYLATNAAHGPMHAPPDAAEPYAELDVAPANFLGMIADLDVHVGRLREHLEELGIADDTIFVFTTDNGTAMGHEVFNAGMRGHKGSEYDGGHRVPFFIHWPAGGLVGGRDVGRVTAHVDVMPTLCELSGVAPPTGVRLDGHSLVPLLTGSDDDWPDRILVTDSQRVIHPRKGRKSAVMTDRWRLVNLTELYDIDRDPGQRRDVAGQHPEVVARLRDFYDAWWAELEPGFADDVHLHLGDPREPIARLTSHDWITEGGAPWHQVHIRRGLDRANTTGYWNVDVVRAGRYSIELRRWPAESGAGIRDAFPPSPDVPGVTAPRTTPGRALAITRATLEIAGLRREQDVTTDADSARFVVELPAGRTELKARFMRDGERPVGAYFAYVQRLD